jgi:hypothetical protein
LDRFGDTADNYLADGGFGHIHWARKLSSAGVNNRSGVNLARVTNSGLTRKQVHWERR